MSSSHAVAGRHAHLHIPGRTVVHRLDPAAKLAGTVAFAVTIAVTPREAWPVVAAQLAIVAGVVALARLPLRTLVARLAALVPLLGVAAVVPFVAGGPETDVFGVGLSRSGLWSAFGIASKTVLGGTASIVLAATTPVPDLIRGLGRLRVPSVIVGIVTFMFRYLDLLVDQLQRMRTAMVARCHDPRWLWQAKPIATAAGTLFVRTYERGERVHLAMLARGYTGTMPEPARRPAADHGRVPWPFAFVPALVAVGALVAWSLR